MSEVLELTPYPLPEGVRQTLLDLAGQSEVLFFGEMHGTQEPPQLVAGLLEPLKTSGYGALALEIPHTTRAPLVTWAESEDAEATTPPFFANPGLDGRGNVQMFALVRAAVRSGWQLLCFDLDVTDPFAAWTERDRRMAENLAAQGEQFAPGKKVVAICGNMHSRVFLPPRHADPFWREHWPSCAAVLQELRPDARVNSVNLVFHGGTFFNMTLRDLDDRPLVAPEVRHPDDAHHTLYLHLPRATAATFLAEPADS